MARKSNKSAPGARTSTPEKPSSDEIAALAHAYYEQEGRIDGRADDHWLRAESDLMRERQTVQPAQELAGTALRNGKSAGEPNQN